MSDAPLPPDSRGSASMNRRNFLQVGTLGGIAAAAATATGTLPLAACTASAPPATFELEERTLVELQAGLKAGQWTARSLTEQYLARIEELDPKLHAIIETNPDALQIADQLDAERRNGRVRGPLHGIPVVVKDNVATKDRMNTTAGSLALLGSKPPRDSYVAARLRAAGAVLLGKANLSEWANYRSTHSSSGWSGRGGQCHNPYILDRSPCGSSSGTGAAVSANLAAIGIGTETDGSIVCPSSANSLVGIKPTVGLVSRAGIVPISHNQDTAGPMARTVADAAALLGVLTGVDPRDPATAASHGHTAPDYTKFLDPNGLEGARIGIARQHYFGYSDKTDRLAEDAIAAMKAAGAVVIDPADIPNARKYGRSEGTVLHYDFKHDLNAYLAELGPDSPVHSLADVIAFNEKNAERELRYFGQETMIAAQEKGPLTEKEYVDALANDHRYARTEGIDAVMDQYRLDALVAPTGSPPWTIDLIDGDHGTGSSSSPAAVAGYPSITVPAGYTFGVPVGISFFGRAWSEPTLIRLAYAFEQATKLRRPPRLLPTLEAMMA